MLRFVFPIVGALFMLTYCVLGNTGNQRVASYILQNYDSRVAPDFLNVNISIFLRRIVDLDVTKKVLTLDAWLLIVWNDNRLAWSEEGDFENTTNMVLPSSSVWIPDIVLFNSANGIETYDKGPNVIVHKSGEIYYYAPVQFSTYCYAGHEWFMRSDKVTCSLIFGSWAYFGNQLNLGILNNGFNLDYYTKDNFPTWSFQDMSCERQVRTYACCPEYEPKVEYSITLRRN